MNVSRVFFNGDKVKIDFTTEDGNGVETTMKLSSKAAPHPDLKASLQLMTKHVKRMCELPDSWLEKFEVRSVRIKLVEEAEELITKIIVSGVREIDSSETPVNISSPYGETEFAKELERVVIEAREYYKGNKRAQGQLFDANGDVPENTESEAIAA